MRHRGQKLSSSKQGDDNAQVHHLGRRRRFSFRPRVSRQRRHLDARPVWPRLRSDLRLDGLRERLRLSIKRLRSRHTGAGNLPAPFSLPAAKRTHLPHIRHGHT
jgi:hypothetical protein